MKHCLCRCPGESRDPYRPRSCRRQVDPGFRRGSVQYWAPSRTVLFLARSRRRRSNLNRGWARAPRDCFASLAMTAFVGSTGRSRRGPHKYRNNKETPFRRECRARSKTLPVASRRSGTETTPGRALYAAYAAASLEVGVRAPTPNPAIRLSRALISRPRTVDSASRRVKIRDQVSR
jgi:hypothetical protein